VGGVIDVGTPQVTGSNNIVGMVSRLINIAPLNDPPEVRLTRTEVGFTEGSELVLIDPNMVLYDADSLELISVTVQITDGYEQGEFGDSLECTQTPSLLTDDRCDPRDAQTELRAGTYHLLRLLEVPSPR
jgi:hypothetical protein